MEIFDVRPYLVSIHDMEFFEEDAEQAADNLNAMLYTIVREAETSDYWNAEKIEQLVVEISEMWVRELGLIESEVDELEDYITHLVHRIEQDGQNEQLDEG